MNKLKNILFDFDDEQLEWLVSTVTNNERKKIDKIKLYKRIDKNMGKFIKNIDKDEFNKFRKNLSDGQQKIFYYMIYVSKEKIPNDFYNNIL